MMIKNDKVIDAILGLDIQEIASLIDSQKSFMDLPTYKFLTELHKIIYKLQNQDSPSLEFIPVQLIEKEDEKPATESFINFISQKGFKTEINKESVEELIALSKDFDSSKVDTTMFSNNLIGKWKKKSNSLLESYAFYSPKNKLYFLLSFEIDRKTKSLLNIWDCDEIKDHSLLLGMKRINFDKIVSDEFLTYQAMPFQQMVEKSINEGLDSIFSAETTILTKENHQAILDKLLSMGETTSILPHIDFQDVSTIFSFYDKMIIKLNTVEEIYRVNDLVDNLMMILNDSDLKKPSTLKWILFGDELFTHLEESYQTVFELKPFDIESKFTINEKPHIVIDQQIIHSIEKLYEKFKSAKKQFLTSN